MREQKKDLFSDKMFYKLWIPSILTAIGLALGDMADAIVVGQKMGSTGLAAVSLALPIYMVINVIIHGFGIGGSVKYSKLIGQGKREEAVSSFNQIFFTVFLVSILCAVIGNIGITPLLGILGVSAEDGAVFEACKGYVTVIIRGMPILFSSYLINYYLRNDNNQTLAAVGFTVGNVSDLIMNIVFVLILDMGVFGAAISTVLGQFISILIYLPGLFGKKNQLYVSFRKMFPVHIKECFRCFKVGLSSSIEYLWHFIFILIINHSLMYYAGANGVAVFDMVQNMSFLISYLYEYTAKATQPLLSTYYGEHNTTGIRHVLRKGLLYGSIVGIGCSILLFAFPTAVSFLFGLEGEELIQMGNQAIRIYCLGGFVAGISIILENYYQSCENEKPAYVLSTLRCAIVQIPVALALIPFGMPLLWLFYPVTEYVSIAIFSLIVKKLKSEPFDDRRIFSKTIENTMDDYTNLLGEVEQFCEKWEADPKQQFFVNMAVEEVCGMIMKRAFADDAQGYIQITLVALPEQEFELHIRDNARLFNPFSQKTRKLGDEDSSDQLDIDAMGILVVKEKAKNFFYHQYQGFNTLIVRI